MGFKNDELARVTSPDHDKIELAWNGFRKSFTSDVDSTTCGRTICCIRLIKIYVAEI